MQFCLARSEMLNRRGHTEHAATPRQWEKHARHRPPCIDAFTAGAPRTSPIQDGGGAENKRVFFFFRLSPRAAKVAGSLLGRLGVAAFGELYAQRHAAMNSPKLWGCATGRELPHAEQASPAHILCRQLARSCRRSLSLASISSPHSTRACASQMHAKGVLRSQCVLPKYSPTASRDPQANEKAWNQNQRIVKTNRMGIT